MSEWWCQRATEYLGVQQFNTWRIRTYIVRADERLADTGQGSTEAVRALSQCVDGIARDHEYRLFHRGIACAHYGRRGFTLALAHFGLWDDMFETFFQAWYSPGETISEFEDLTSRDPMLCFHDIPVLLPEIASVRSHILGAIRQNKQMSMESLLDGYMLVSPPSHG